jgi:phage tail tube protein FII
MSDREQAYVGLSLTVNGFGFIGSLIEFKEPVVVEQTEDYRGGRSAPTKMMLGYEPVEATFKLSRDDISIAAARAIIGRDVVMTFRGSIDERGSKIDAKWIIYGRITGQEAQTITAGSKVEKNYTVAVEKFIKTLAGVPAEAFDIATGELKFSTTDVLADVKAQIGL